MKANELLYVYSFRIAVNSIKKIYYRYYPFYVLQTYGSNRYTCKQL